MWTPAFLQLTNDSPINKVMNAVRHDIDERGVSGVALSAVMAVLVWPDRLALSLDTGMYRMMMMVCAVLLSETFLHMR